MSGNNNSGAPPLLTASLTAKVSNLKSLSEAFKELERAKSNEKGGSKGPLKL